MTNTESSIDKYCRQDEMVHACLYVCVCVCVCALFIFYFFISYIIKIAGFYIENRTVYINF